MPKVQREASLHEKTVQGVAREGVEQPRRTRGPDKRTRQRTQRTKVHPIVWEYALRVSDGDLSRIEVRSETEVVIWNRGP